MQVDLALHAAGDELGVVDVAVVVDVEKVHDVLHLGLFVFDTRVLKTILELILGDAAISVRVNFDKERSEVLNALLRELRSQVDECRLLEVDGVHEILHVVKGISCNIVVLGINHGLDPGVVVGLGRGVALRHVFDKEVGDQIFRLAGDALEAFVFEVVFSPKNVLYDLFIALAREGDLAREQNVHDDTYGPEVAFRVVPLIEDLRGNVVGLKGFFIENLQNRRAFA